MLKRLEILGFKSFARKTVFEFSPGITAIVGPNGSGKSNVADAIRWVLGEQSSRSLRTRRMDEVIFSGGGSRGAMGMAEVSLVLDNEGGTLPMDAAEVQVTRRLYRSGEGEYLLNGRRVRLRDLADLLGRAHVGQSEYTVIGQGLIDVVLSLKPEERRVLIEEAADVRRHYGQIEETRRRLEQTDANMARVDDLLAELAPRVDRLRQQAERARSAREIAEQLRRTLERWYGHRVASLRQRLAARRAAAVAAAQARQAAAARLQEHQVAADRADEDLRRLRTQVEATRATVASIDAQVGELRRSIALDLERRRGLDAQIADLEVDVRVLDEDRSVTARELADASGRCRQAAEARQAARSAADAAAAALDQVERRIQQLRSEQRTLDAAAEEHRTGVRRLEARLEDLRDQLQRLEADQGATQDGLTVATSEVAAAEAAHRVAIDASDRAEARLASAELQLRQMEAELRTVGEGGARARLELQLLEQEREQLERQLSRLAEAEPGVSSQALADRPSVLASLEVPPDYERALVAALGPALEARVAGSVTAASLERIDAGRVAVPIDPIEWPPGARVVGRALDLVSGPPELAGLLSRVLLVTDLAAALDCLGSFPGDVVTLGGIVCRSTGIIEFDGPAATAAGRLEAQRLRREIETRLAEAAVRIDAARRAVAAASEAEALARERVQHRQRARIAAVEKVRSAADAVELTRQALMRARQESDWRARVAAESAARIATLKDQQAETLRRLSELSAAGVDARPAEVTAELEGLETLRRSRHDTLTEARVADADAEAAWQEAGRSEARLRDALARLDRQRLVRQERLSQAIAQRDLLAASIARAEAAALALDASLAEARRQLAPLEAALSEVESRQAASSTELRETERTLLEREREHILAEAERERAEAAWEALVVELDDDGIELHKLAAASMEDEDLPSLERQVRSLRHQARLAGNADLEVVAEFESESARVAALHHEVADLQAARAQLCEVIRDLEEHSVRQFAIAFDAVSREFQAFFQRFFGGGAARLVLTHPHDLAQTGIEIEAQPPGKRFRSLALLSGGERALTAAALVFAVIQINPSPFSVLDEVDAALDEANVGRFAEALRELSARTQFIIVTHNRNTIDRADSIYGMTMGSDGVSRVMSITLKRYQPRGDEPAREETLALTG